MSGTVISIDYCSVQRQPHLGQSIPLPSSQVSGLALGCARLLEFLGPIADLVEVIKVVPWHAYGKPNLFDIKCILAMSGDGQGKVTVEKTIELSRHLRHSEEDYHFVLAEVISSILIPLIYRAMLHRIDELQQLKARWEEFKPKFPQT